MSDITSSSRLLMIDESPEKCLDILSQPLCLKDWSTDDFLHVCCEDEFPEQWDAVSAGQPMQDDIGSLAAKVEKCVQFRPGIICFRPAASVASFKLVILLLEAMPDVPLVVYMTEDWLKPLRDHDQKRFIWFDTTLRKVLAKSVRRLCIGSDMARTSAASYGGYWISCTHLEKQYLSFPLIPAGKLLLGPFARKQSAHIDETTGIAHLYAGVQSSGKTMIDVGAHLGSACRPFLDKGWQVYAFEPDDQNRAGLSVGLSTHANRHLLTLDPRCVSNQTSHGLAFYRSAQSSGISGLSAFHPSHVETQQVSTITLNDFFADKIMSEIDFLKIDTEGHDLFVLQGFPWARTKPAVIECEFEDAKTLPLGYGFHELAKFLVDQGYCVYVSEWHPIRQYGIRHDWYCLAKYPYVLKDENSWGNLLAFRDHVDELTVTEALRNLVRLPSAMPDIDSNVLP